MGYTHYWTFKKPAKGQAASVEAAYQKAVLKCQKLIYTYNQQVKKSDQSDERHLSGYNAHTKPGSYGGVKLNGKGENGHEDFILREHYKQNFEAGQFSDGGFHFCKTARKPYDAVVVACLLILKHYLGDNIELGSDGGCSDWGYGFILARHTAKVPLKSFPKELRHELYILRSS